MEYKGKYKAFDFGRIKTYPLAARVSKITNKDLVYPDKVTASDVGVSRETPALAVADAIKAAREKDQPVILFTGAHIIKNGFGPLLVDLMDRGIVTLLGMNMAGMIHDLELALVGKTSEDVPAALPKGEFGFAAETGELINKAFVDGEKRRTGAGEAIGSVISSGDFPYKETSVLCAGYEHNIPVTLHAGIGTDVIDQQPSFDPAAKGGCSGRDFAVFCAEVERMKAGGVFLNIGSAVTGPEVLLKACSMAANVGNPPKGIITAVFDFQAADPGDVNDQRKAGYYRRDLKSVVVRIPEAFGGKGYYVQGDHLDTVPTLYKLLIQQ